MIRNSFWMSVFVTLAALMASGRVLAQAESPEAYPSKPVRVIIPFAPGGSTDIIGRISAELLARELGQQFLPVNVGGAGGTTGAIQVARAKPDGYTLMLGSAGTIINNPQMRKDIGYDPLKDFHPISPLWGQRSVVAVRKDGPYATFQQLIAEAKRRPGALNYGSSGAGSLSHISTEYMAALAGIKMTHIPYKGAAPAITDLAGGTLDVVLIPVSSLLGYQDRLVGLAIAAPSRSSFAPNVPTAAEAGLPGFVYSSWGGLFAPAGVSPRIAERLSGALAKVMKQEEVKKRFMAQGVDPEFSTPDEYRVAIAAEFKRVGQLMESIGLKGM